MSEEPHRSGNGLRTLNAFLQAVKDGKVPEGMDLDMWRRQARQTDDDSEQNTIEELRRIDKAVMEIGAAAERADRRIVRIKKGRDIFVVKNNTADPAPGKNKRRRKPLVDQGLGKISEQER